MGLVLLPSSRARAQEPAAENRTEVCFSAYEESQVALKENAMIQAQSLALECSRQCPEEIIQACGALLSNIETDIPTALVLARTERGADAKDVSVTIDGVPRNDALGSEIPLDPGPHAFAFQNDGGWKENLSIVVRLGEKRRQIRVLVPNAQKPEPEPPPTPPISPEKRRKHWSFSVGISTAAVGGAGLLTAIVAGSVALSTKNKLDQTCSGNLCDATYVERKEEIFDSWLKAADIGLVVGAVGVAAGTSLLVWGVRNKWGRRAQIGVMPTIGGASAAITGTF